MLKYNALLNWMLLRGHSTVPGLIGGVAHNVRHSGKLSIDYSRHLHARLVDCKLGLKPFILNLVDLRQSVFDPASIDNPCLHVCCTIPAHISYMTAVALLFNCKVGSSGGKTLPTSLVSAIALYQIVQAKSCSPTDITATWAAGPKLLNDRDLSVLQQEIAIG